MRNVHLKLGPVNSPKLADIIADVKGAIHRKRSRSDARVDAAKLRGQTPGREKAQLGRVGFRTRESCRP